MTYTQRLVGALGIMSVLALAPLLASAQTVAPVSTSAQASFPCVALTSNYGYGHSASAELAALQLFLYSRGYFTSQITGPFGPMTRAAIVHFQRDNDLPSTGFVGALTRALLSRWCGTKSNVWIQTITPVSGPTGTTVTITGSGFTQDNTIHFGSGVVVHVPSEQAIYNCPMMPAGSSGTCGGASQFLTFTVPASLNPACYYSTPRCLIASMQTLPGAYNVSVENTNGTSNAATFTVTSGDTTNAPVISSVTPTAGPVGTTVTITGRGFEGTNTVRFGNGAIQNVPITSSIAVACTTDPSCIPGIRQTLVFTVPSSIGPDCPQGSMCPMWLQQVTPGVYQVAVQNTSGTSNSESFTVTSGTTTNPTAIWSVSPGNASQGQLVTIRGAGFTQGSVVHFFQNGQAFGTMGGVTVVNDTTITFSVPEWIGVYCRMGNPCVAMAKQLPAGNYSIAVEDQNGTTNQYAFTVVDGSSSGPISITGLDAPATLAMGVSGTWTVHASVPSTSGQLHYSVNWGDAQTNASFAAPQATTIQTSATFTHAYGGAGTYTPVFTVTDDSGHSATVSATITVTPWY